MKKHIDNNDTWQERIRRMGMSGNEDHLPASSGVWEKLEGKLAEQERRDQHEKKRRRMVYWLAAAVSASMLLLFTGKELFHSKTNGVIENNHGIVVAPTIHNDNNDPEQQSNNLTSNPKPYKNNLTNKATKQPAVHLQQPTPNYQHSNPPDTLPGLAQNSAEPPKLVTMIKPDTIVVAKAIVKRPLRTSHISDYTETIETTPGITMKPKPLRRFIRGTNDEETEKAAAVTPVKPHYLIKSSTIQN